MLERPHDHLRCPLFHELDGECCRPGETCCMLPTPQIDLRDHNVAVPLINMGETMQLAVLGFVVLGLMIFGAPKLNAYFGAQAKINQEIAANGR